MLGSIAGLYADFFMWGNIEGIFDAAIKGGEHRIQSAPVNFVYNKIRKMAGKEAVEGLYIPLKFAGAAGGKALLGKAVAGYFFNPYVGLVKSAVGAAVDFRKGEMEADFTRHTTNSDLSMSYHLDESFRAINNSNLQNMEMTSHQITKILSAGNLAEDILEQTLRRG